MINRTLLFGLSNVCWSKPAFIFSTASDAIFHHPNLFIFNFTMTLAAFNDLDKGVQKEMLTQCCGASSWVGKMMAALPFKSLEQVNELATKYWQDGGPHDWLEAFKHHPKIGDLQSLKKKFASTAAWASGEQAGVHAATEQVLQKLAMGNEAYLQKFGFIFIVCATGKPATEMLALLEGRLPNNPEEELQIAAAEQAKITAIRLKKLFA